MFDSLDKLILLFLDFQKKTPFLLPHPTCKKKQNKTKKEEKSTYSIFALNIQKI